MSRIYEALQRAEAERQLEREEQQRRLTGAPETEKAPPPLPPRVPPMAPTRRARRAHGHARAAAIYSASDPQRLPTSRLRALLLAVDRAPGVRARGHRRPASRAAHALERDPRDRLDFAVERFPALEQRGAMVEQFRSLRSRLEEFRAMNRLQSLLVSSGVPQEGKSFIAANLALSLALHKSSKVLLVDGDMRRSTLQEYFGCEAHPGLSDYLSGKCELGEAMSAPQRPARPRVSSPRSSTTSCSSPAVASATAPRTSPAAPASRRCSASPTNTSTGSSSTPRP